MASRITASLPQWMEEVEEVFDRRIDGGVQVLVFNKQTEFRQSNIGAASDEENNIGEDPYKLTIERVTLPDLTVSNVNWTS